MAKATEEGGEIVLRLNKREATFLRNLIGWKVSGYGPLKKLNDEVWSALCSLSCLQSSSMGMSGMVDLN